MDQSSKKILIVDDEPGVRDILRVNLESEGYVVSEASDGFEALERTQAEAPDLIVLDLMMPRLSGWEVLCRLEGDPASAGTPVVILSALSDEANIMRGLEQGALDYVPKPFDPLVISQKVRLLLKELDGRGRQVYRQQAMECRRRNMQSLDRFFGSGAEQRK
jgi:DNA-binding response OmpR family regulator